MTASEAASGIRRTWREAPPAVRAVVAGMLVNRLGGFLQVFLALFLVHNGFGTVRAGIALGAYATGSVLGVLVGGWLVARIGVRLSIVSSMTATAVLTAALLYASPYPLILVLATAVGATSQVYRPASGELVGRLTPEGRQVMVFAMYRLATNVGATVAPLLGAALLTGSYGFLFWSEAAAALGCALIGAFALPHDRPARE
ncbi:MAG: hypothetical protein QOF98_1287, partial [Streptomyces sp.]|nr:hypothetical protein [Streptomyces sp.]